MKNFIYSLLLLSAIQNTFFANISKAQNPGSKCFEKNNPDENKNLEKILFNNYQQVKTNYIGEDQDFTTVVYANEVNKTWSLVGIPKDPESINLPKDKEVLCYIGSGTDFPSGLLKMEIPSYDGAHYPTPNGSRDCQQDSVGDKPSCYLSKPLEWLNNLFN